MWFVRRDVSLHLTVFVSLHIKALSFCSCPLSSIRLVFVCRLFQKSHFYGTWIAMVTVLCFAKLGKMAI